MYNFVVVDDFPIIANLIEKCIRDVIGKNPRFNVHKFYDYNSETYNFIDNDLKNKIYILDIETPTSSGLEYAKKIRENDIDSLIIFSTAYREDYKISIFESEFMAIGSLSKSDTDFESKLKSKIKYATTMIGSKRIIRMYYKESLVTFNFDDILYITTSDKRTTKIKTIYGEMIFNLSLKELVEVFDNRLTRTHGSCYINDKNLLKIDFKKGIIYFKNGDKINLLSREYKKELKKNL